MHIIPTDHQFAFFSLDLKEWVLWMIRSSSSTSMGPRGAEKAMLACWWQWRWRNGEIFRGERFQLQQKLRLVLGSQEEEEAFRADSVHVGRRAGAFGSE